MQILKTLTAFNGESNTYSIRRLDDQSIQPNWTFKWTIMDLGAGEILSSSTSNSVVVVWNENTAPNQWFTLKCEVNMGDTCIREIGIKVKVTSVVTTLITTITESIEHQCTKIENGTNIDELSGNYYIAHCDGATKILWNITGGKFIKNGTLESGPIQEIPDGNGNSTIRVVWNNSSSIHTLTAQGSDNNNNLSNIASNTYDVLPPIIEAEIEYPSTVFFDDGDYEIKYVLYDIPKLPYLYEGNLGDTSILTYLYVGILKEGLTPDDAGENFVGDYWLYPNANNYIGLNTTTAHDVRETSSILSTTYKVPLEYLTKTYNIQDTTQIRYKLFTKFTSKANTDCYFYSNTLVKTTEVIFCPKSIKQGNIVVEAQWCPSKIATGNISVVTTECPSKIPVGIINIVPGLYDPKPIGTPIKIPIYIPKPIGTPTPNYIYMPIAIGTPIKIPIYIPKPIGDPTAPVDVIYIPSPIGVPIKLPIYIPKPIGTPVSRPVYLPKSYGTPIKIPIYIPKPIGTPVSRPVYLPKSYGTPIKLPTYIPKPFGRPIKIPIYIPKPIGTPVSRPVYLPKSYGTPIKLPTYIPKPFGEPIKTSDVIYVPSPFGKPFLRFLYVPNAFSPKTVRTIYSEIKGVETVKVSKEYTYNPTPISVPYVYEGIIEGKHIWDKWSSDWDTQTIGTIGTVGTI